MSLSLSPTTEVAEGLDRALAASGLRAAKGLRMSHEERVVFAVGRQVPRDVSLEVLLGEAVLVGIEETDPPTDPQRVGIDNEDRMAPRVQQDRVCRLGADTILGEEIGAHHVRRPIEILREVASRLFDDMAAEVPELRRFRAVEAGDVHVFANDVDLRGSQRLDIQKAGDPQVLDGGVHVPPRGLLHEQGTDDDLEGVLRGPPVLMAVSREEPTVHFAGSVHHAAASPPGTYASRFRAFMASSPMAGLCTA